MEVKPVIQIAVSAFIALCSVSYSAAAAVSGVQRIHSAHGKEIDFGSRLEELELRLLNVENELSKQKQELEIVQKKNSEQSSRIDALEVVIKHHEKRLETYPEEDDRTQQNSLDSKSVHQTEAILNSEDFGNTDLSEDPRRAKTSLVRRPRTDNLETFSGKSQSVLLSSETKDDLEETLKRQSRQLKYLLREHEVDEDLRPLPQTVEEINGTDSHSRSKRRVRAYRVPRHSIAFTAYLQSELFALTPSQVLVLSGVLTNEGHGYDPSSGVFTCPISGVYLFTFFIADMYVEELNVNLVVDGANAIGASAEPRHYSQDIQGGNAAVLRLFAGQRVWLATTDLSGVTVVGSNRFRDTSFSGVLLHQ